jgi:hypothetical protein
MISHLMTEEDKTNSLISLFALERSNPFTIVPFNDLQIVCNFLNNYKQLPTNSSGNLHLISMRKIKQQFLPLFGSLLPPIQSTLDDFVIKNQIEFIKCLSILDPYFDNNLTSKYADVFCRILSKLLILTFKNPFFWTGFDWINCLTFHLDFCIKFAKLIALEEELIYPIPIFTISENDFHIRPFYVWNTNSYNSILRPDVYPIITGCCQFAGCCRLTEITSDEFIKLKSSQNRISISISPEVDILLNK